MTEAAEADMCPNTGWTQHSSEFYHCDTCGLTAHWMDMRPHSRAARSEQVVIDAGLRIVMDDMYASLREDLKYRRGECPA